MNPTPPFPARKFAKTRSLSILALVAWLVCLAAPLHAQYAGNYSGTFEGDSDWDSSGVWSFTVDASGNLTGRAVDTYGEVTTGSGSVQAVGTFAMVMAAGSDVTFSGEIDASGNVSGTWEDSYWLESGSVTGTRLPTTVAQYAGTYSGTLVGVGVSGTWASTVDSAGNWTGSGTVTGIGTYGVNGIVSGTGAITTYIEEGGILTGQINASGQASGTWTDYETSGTFTGTRTSITAPEIVVEQPVGSNIPDGGTNNFGSVGIGSSLPLTFTIKNTGNANLTGLSITKDGTHAANFTVGALGATTLAPGISTTFTVTFSPSASGSRTAAIHIASNDADENPFDISLTGTGLSSLEIWRQTHFGSPADSGDGANSNDFDKDGIPNLLEFAFGLHPKQNSAGLLPKPQSTGGNLVLTFTQPAAVNGITYGAEWSPSMAPGSWQSLTNTGTPPQHTFSTPIDGNMKKFVRLKVTVQ